MMNLLNQIQDFFSKYSIPYLFNFILLIHLIGFFSFKMGLDYKLDEESYLNKRRYNKF